MENKKIIFDNELNKDIINARNANVEWVMKVIFQNIEVNKTD